MKLNVLLFLVAAGCAFSADSQLERELKLLTDQRDAAVAIAAEPINRRYQTSLEQLLKRATQAGDLDASVKIQEALSRIVPVAPQTKSSLVKLLTSGRWEWFSSSDFSGKAYHITLAEDNKCTIEPGVQFLSKWEALNSKQVRIYLKSGNFYVFDIDAAKHEGVNNSREATQKEAKSIRLERK